MRAKYQMDSAHYWPMTWKCKKSIVIYLFANDNKCIVSIFLSLYRIEIKSLIFIYYKSSPQNAC